MRKLFPLALILLAALPVRPQAPVDTSLDPARLKLIPVRLQELVENQTIPGAVALVARHGEIASLDAVGWRDIEDRKPMTTDSIFQIMSMTKQFTGVGAMMLVDEGKLELRVRLKTTFPSSVARWLKNACPMATRPRIRPRTRPRSGS